MPEVSVEDTDAGMVTREFEASFAKEDTKTSLVNGYKVQWNAGDVINYYSQSVMQKRDVEVSVSGSSAHLKLTLGQDDRFVAAAYGASIIPSGGAFILDGLVKPQQNGRFASAHASMAFTDDLESGHLLFYNVTSLISFKLQRNDIYYVLFHPASSVPSGRAKVSVSSGYPDISGLTPTGDSIDEIKVLTSSGAGEYFISMFPGTISGGFEMEFYNSSGVLLGTVESSKTLTVKRNTILNLGLLDGRIEAPEQHGGGTKSGLYLGIIGFNDELYKMDIERLDANSKTHFDAFIDGLTTKNGTLLYYSVDQSLRTLKQAQYPDDLYNVSLVTFTDGLDMGSAMMMDNYTTDDECLETLHNKLATSSYAGIPLTSYSIGLTGNDVNTTQQREMFRKNIKKLAYPESNAYEVDDMSSVNARFQEIADKISQTTSTTKYQLELTVPGKADGTMWRITLDGASSATSSAMYIEGTFNLSTKALTNVTYHGMTCGSGSTIQGKVNGIHITYTFSDIIPDSGAAINKDRVWTWWYAHSSSDFWQGNTEFDKDNDVKIIVTHTRQSVVVLLDLDCSRSLDNQFSTLKSHAKSFVATLYNASLDPYEVTGISLDKSELSIFEGRQASLIATINPPTAADQSIKWTSSNSFVAAVDGNGTVTGVKAGTAIIKATTVDGGYVAYCSVTVLEAAVDLGLSVKWAAVNLGANAPEEFGDYYAWGETHPKNSYSLDNYKYWIGNDAEGKALYSKYNTEIEHGVIDNNYVLYSEDDAVVANLGGSFRMPTDIEFQELESSCDMIWTTKNGINGFLLTSRKNGNSIFFPATGNKYSSSVSYAGSAGYYLSSTMDIINYPVDCVRCLCVSSNGCWATNFATRGSGYPIRPVLDDNHISVKSVGLNKTALSLNRDNVEQLIATVLPENSTNKYIIWSSDNTAVVYVNAEGVVIAKSVGTATITATTYDGSHTAKCVVSVTDAPQVPDAIDLGLSVDWASWNVGACAPENSGYYFAWGETSPKQTFTIENYRFRTSGTYYDNMKLSKYNTLSDCGNVDNKTVLEANDDAAHTQLGGSWRMPTKVEIDELYDNCNYTWITLNGVPGMQLTSKINGKSVFLPKVGYWSESNVRDYAWNYEFWSSSLNTTSPKQAELLSFRSYWSPEQRYLGHPIRPVRSKVNHEMVDLGLSVKWATCNVGASSPEEYGDYFAWGETEPYYEDGYVFSITNSPVWKSDKTAGYTWSSYRWWNESSRRFTKYVLSNNAGTVDNRTVLELSDDAARANWGGNWRMPTDAEWTELINNCTWTWTTQNGKSGYRVTSNKSGYTDKSIFLRPTGYRRGTILYEPGNVGSYWSSSLRTDFADNCYSGLSIGFGNKNFSVSSHYRADGLSVRAVTE
ncbi:MAG: Ig-like domain-containing protein [Bacteroidales bacterium]|nr:Ig-like domain-containing protein [Bacteroidales bacterium]